MRHLSLVIFCVVALATIAIAQPQHGDLILTLNDSRTWQWGVVVVMNPRSGMWTTLAGPFTGDYLATVRMAPDNRSVVVPKQVSPAGWPSDILEIAASGSQTTLATVPDGGPEGILLDHDDTWIMSGSDWKQASLPNCTWSLGHGSRTLTTLFSTPGGTGWYNDICTWRDSGGYPYAIAIGNNPTTLSRPNLLLADRTGIRSTLIQGSGPPLPQMTTIEPDPRLGDYLVTGYWATGRVSSSGKLTTLPTSFGGGNGAHVNQDGTAWVLGQKFTASGPATVYKIDAAGSVVTMLPMAPYPAASFSNTGITVYGSRVLVCNQPAATPSTVTVKLQSLLPSIQGGEQYVLAASFGRRPGVKFASGDWLNLNAADPLFFVSALNLLPGVFQSFQGQLNAFGSATATVNIPSGLPPLNDMPVFVGGVIHSGGNVIQVTNTHWFVLP